MNYKVMVRENLRCEIVDTRDPINYEDYIGEVVSSWKSIIKNSARRYYRSGTRDIHDGYFYILTYPDKSIDVVNPGKGDYIKPGYTQVSRQLSGTISSRDCGDIIGRCKIKTFRSYLINDGMLSSYLMNRQIAGVGVTSDDFSHSYYVHSGSIDKVNMPGWSVSPYRRGMSVECSMSGIKISNRNHVGDVPAEQRVLFISQDILKAKLEGTTSVRVKATNAVSVLLDTDMLTYQGDGMWLWEGDAITTNKKLSIQCGMDYISGIEVFTDND